MVVKLMIIKKLDEIAEIFNGARLSRYQDDDGEEFKVFLGTPTDQISWQKEKISSKLNHKYFSKKNDIILNLQNSKIIEFVKEDNIIIPMHYAIIRLNKEFNSEYVYYYLKTSLFQKQLHKYKEGSSLLFINLSALKNIKINLPERNIQEQYVKLFRVLDKKSELRIQENKLLEDFRDLIFKDINKEK